MTEWNDKCVQAMCKGENNAFEQCYQSLAPTVYTAIFRICQDQQTAQDLLHDTFIDAFEKINSFNQQRSFVAWLKRIAFNNTFNYIKRQKLTLEVVDQLSIREEPGLTPEQLISDRNLLTKLLDTVPTSHRLVLWLFIVEQYSHDEIGTLTGKSASYSKSIVSRSLQKLKDHPATKSGLTAGVNNNAY